MRALRWRGKHRRTAEYPEEHAVILRETVTAPMAVPDEAWPEHPLPESAACPVCRVPAAEWCRDEFGRVMPWPHMARHGAAHRAAPEAWS